MLKINFFSKKNQKWAKKKKTENPAFFDRMAYEPLRTRWYQVQRHLLKLKVK